MNEWMKKIEFLECSPFATYKGGSGPWADLIDGQEDQKR